MYADKIIAGAGGGTLEIQLGDGENIATLVVTGVDGRSARVYFGPDQQQALTTDLGAIVIGGLDICLLTSTSGVGHHADPAGRIQVSHNAGGPVVFAVDDGKGTSARIELTPDGANEALLVVAACGHAMST